MYPGLLGSSTVLMVKVHEMDGMSNKEKLTEICPKWLVFTFHVLMLIFTVLKLIVCNE